MSRKTSIRRKHGRGPGRGREQRSGLSLWCIVSRAQSKGTNEWRTRRGGTGVSWVQGPTDFLSLYSTSCCCAMRVLHPIVAQLGFVRATRLNFANKISSAKRR